ncbi:MAG: hypothetical protein ACI9FB_004567 [Candidatus Azotimanducaceae bacterium]|jgi:hypothetical protein
MRETPPNKMRKKELARWPVKLHCVLRSIDMVGYQALVIVDGQELLLVDKNDKPLCFASQMHMREALKKMPLLSLTLRHESAYEEMINQPPEEVSNALEASLSLDPYPFAAQEKPTALGDKT